MRILNDIVSFGGSCLKRLSPIINFGGHCLKRLSPLICSKILSLKVESLIQSAEKIAEVSSNTLFFAEKCVAGDTAAALLEFESNLLRVVPYGLTPQIVGFVVESIFKKFMDDQEELILYLGRIPTKNFVRKYSSIVIGAQAVAIYAMFTGGSFATPFVYAGCRITSEVIHALLKKSAARAPAQENENRAPAQFNERQIMQAASVVVQISALQSYIAGYQQGHHAGFQIGAQMGALAGSIPAYQQGYQKGRRDGTVSGVQFGAGIGYMAGHHDGQGAL